MGAALRRFVAQQEPAEPRDASTAAEVRDAFFQFCGGSVPKREVGLKLAGKGFSEESAHTSGLRRVCKSVYRVKLGDTVALVKLKRVFPMSGGPGEAREAAQGCLGLKRC